MKEPEPFSLSRESIIFNLHATLFNELDEILIGLLGVRSGRSKVIPIWVERSVSHAARLEALTILCVAAAVSAQEIIPANYRDYRGDYRDHRGDYRDHRHYGGAYPYNYYPYDETPKPYAFNYNALLYDGGQSSRVEAADGTGKVEGSYTVTNDEGHTRVVDYVADQGGFRANIRTNEPGTDNKNPADVVIDSTAPFTPYQYVPRYRRPYANPLAPAAVAPGVDDVVDPTQPGFYNNPGAYANRNYYRPRPRNPYLGY